MSTRAAARPRWRRSGSGASWAPLWAWRRRRRRWWCCGSACWTGGRWRRSANRSSPFSPRLPRAWSREFCSLGAVGGEAAPDLLPGPGVLLGSALGGHPGHPLEQDVEQIPGFVPWGESPCPPALGSALGSSSRRGMWNKSWSSFLE